MKYFLVAVLNRESTKDLEYIQRPLVKKGRNSKKPPYMAIPIDTIEDPDKDKLNVFLEELLKPFRYFHVDITGKYINVQDEKLTGLPVTNFGYIKKIQRHLNEYMELSGYKVSQEKSDDKDFIFSMSVDRLPKDLENTKNLFDTPDNKKMFLVDRIELWKTMNAKKDSVVFSIPLKNPKIL